MIRQDAVLNRAEQCADDTEQEQRDEQDRNRRKGEPGDGDEGDPDLDEFQPPATSALSKRSAICPPNAGEEKKRRDEHAAANCERLGHLAADMEDDQESQRLFEEISLNAEKNWHQNRGAKRRDSKSDLDAAGDGSVMGQAYAKHARLRPASCAATGECNIDRIPQNNRGEDVMSLGSAAPAGADDIVARIERLPSPGGT